MSTSTPPQPCILRPHGVTPLGVPLQWLYRFRDGMARQGHTVRIAQMAFDRIYALERIASGHASADPVLRKLALKLFYAYQGERDLRSGNTA